MSSKFPCSKKGSKHFFGYKSNKKITPMYVLLSNMSGYVKIIEDVLFGQRWIIISKIQWNIEQD